MVQRNDTPEKTCFVVQFLQKYLVFSAKTNHRPPVTTKTCLRPKAFDHDRPEISGGDLIVVEIVVFAVLHQGQRIERRQEKAAIEGIYATKRLDNAVYKPA